MARFFKTHATAQMRSHISTPLPAEQAEMAPFVAAQRQDRAKIAAQLFALPPTTDGPPPALCEDLIQHIKSPLRRMASDAAEQKTRATFVQNLQDAIKARDPARASLMLAGTLLTTTLPELPPLKAELLCPWTAPLIGAALGGVALVSISDDETATQKAMRWCMNFATMMARAHDEGTLIGGSPVWKKDWLPVLAFETPALLFYSSFLNIKPFLDVITPLRQAAFAAQKQKDNKPAAIILNQLPPRRSDDKRIRVALYATLFDSHSHGLPHTIFWASCLDRSRYEPVFVFHINSKQLLEENFFFNRYPTVSSYAPVIVIREENLEALKEFDFDLFYNFDDLCKGHNERSGYTRIAPVQATGFYTPATTGAPCVDAFLTAPDLDPYPQDAFSEKVIFSDGLPFCFHYESYYGVTPQRAFLDADIPEDAIVYTSGSSVLTKIRPIFTEAVLDILEKEPRAIWIFAVASNKKERLHLVEDILTRCQARGLNPNRIRLYKYISRPLLLGLVKACDVFLDFFPFTGTNNILDPIEVATPCVTLCADPGYSRNRIAAMILRQVKLPDLVAPTVQDFVVLALKLGQDRALNESIRARMGGQALRASPLCDGQTFMVRIEKAFEEMLKIANLAPPPTAPANPVSDRRNYAELTAQLNKDFSEFNRRQAMWCLDADMRDYGFESFKAFLPQTQKNKATQPQNASRALVLYPQNVTEIKHVAARYDDVVILSGQTPILEHLGFESEDLAFDFRDDPLETFGTREGDANFDAIFSFHHLQLTENPKDILRHAHRLLRADGLLFIAVPNAASGSRRLALELGFIKSLYDLPQPLPFACAPKIRHIFDRPQLLDLLENAHFTIKDSGGLLFKTLTDAQMHALEYQKMIGKPYYDALYKLGTSYPDLCYTVFAIAQKT